MSDLVGNPEDRVSHNEAELVLYIVSFISFAEVIEKRFLRCINFQLHEIDKLFIKKILRCNKIMLYESYID